MTDQPEDPKTPKIIGLNGKPYVPKAPPDVPLEPPSLVDEAMIKMLDAAKKLVVNGELEGMVLLSFDANGVPYLCMRFRQGEDPRAEATRFLGNLKLAETFLMQCIRGDGDDDDDEDGDAIELEDDE